MIIQFWKWEIIIRKRDPIFEEHLRLQETFMRDLAVTEEQRKIMYAPN